MQLESFVKNGDVDEAKSRGCDRMKYKATLYFGDEEICSGEFETSLLHFPRLMGNIYTDSGFKIVYKALKTKANKKEIDEFLKKYPNPESYPTFI